MKAIAELMLAGGQGSRMGRPKQVLKIGGKAVLVRSIEAFKASKLVNKIVVVTTPENFKEVSALFSDISYAPAGASRIESLQNGLAALGAADLIAVHDGARPLVKAEYIDKCLAEAEKYGAAVLCVPGKGTIKQGKEGVIEHTFDRNVLLAAEKPQGYKGALVKEAMEKYGSLKEATGESQLVEKLGVKVRAVKSGYENLKITTPEDLTMAEALLCKQK